MVTGSVSGEGGGAKKVWFYADYIGKNAIFAFSFASKPNDN